MHQSIDQFHEECGDDWPMDQSPTTDSPKPDRRHNQYQQYRSKGFSALARIVLIGDYGTGRTGFIDAVVGIVGDFLKI
jgi:hypothetical protein